MMTRLDGKVAIDFPTARRLFTLLCVLHHQIKESAAMKIDGTPYRSVWVDPDDGWSVRIFDQTKLPWALEILRLTTVGAGRARHQQHAGARRPADRRRLPLTNYSASPCAPMPPARRWNMTGAVLAATRPTAVNLRWAIERMLTVLRNTAPADRVAAAYAEAGRIADEDAAQCEAIGRRGVALIADIAAPHRPSRQRAYPLQCRLARHGGLGHGARADLHGGSSAASICMSGWTKPARATRGRR